MTLNQKTMHGLGWSGASQIIKQAGQFVITMVLARLLSPNDFGLLAMAMVFVNFATIFGELGISSALIQKQDTHDRHYDSAFWLNIAAGILLTGIFMGASYFIAMFYRKPELQEILMVIAFNFVISSFVVVQQAILMKEMDFKSLAIRDVLAVLIAGTVGIILAYKGFGVWSLVYQSLTFSFVNTILLWTLSKWRPRFVFALSDIKDIFHFSANITGFNIVNFFARNIDQLLIGKFLGVQALGYYSLAYKLMLYPLQNISMVVGKVMFPAFSRIQSDLQKVREVYIKMLKAISLITFPLMFGLFAIAPEFVQVIYGPKWRPVVILIRILCLCGVVQSVGTTIGNIFLSLGRADLQFKLQVTGTIIVTALIILGLNWGLVGVATFYLIYSVLWVHYSLFLASGLIKLKFLELYRNLLPSYGLGLGILFLVFSFKKFFVFSLLNQLVISVVIEVVFYLIFLFFNEYIRITNRKIYFNLY